MILAAGVGSRLGKPHPKPLTPIAGGRTIMDLQLRHLSDRFDANLISTVVGFKKEMIMEEHPEVSYIYNDEFGDTNTSKSLLRGLRLTGNDPVLWLNGDVVFDPTVLEIVQPYIDRDQSFVAVNTESVSDEEVKYTLDDRGFINEISKEVSGGLGEAVGINFVGSSDKPFLAARLEDCGPQDYVERGIVLAIQRDRRKFRAIDISAARCMEVDFPTDLAQAETTFADLASTPKG